MNSIYFKLAADQNIYAHYVSPMVKFSRRNELPVALILQYSILFILDLTKKRKLLLSLKFFVNEKVYESDPQTLFSGEIPYTGKNWLHYIGRTLIPNTSLYRII